jgi:hypothetical protein
MPPGARVCPTCGKGYASPPAGSTPTAQGRRRLQLHRGVRIAVIVGIALGLSGVMALALYQGPPIAADPLTGKWVLTIAPGGFASFNGAVTGGDFITGNFSVFDPPGAVVVVAVFNASEFGRFHSGLPASPAQSTYNESTGILDFAALYTDTYYFVFENHYSAASQIGLKVFVSTMYQSNVVVE